MKKRRKRQQKQPSFDLKSILYFECIGLALALFSILAIAKLGVVGVVLVSFARFFLGEWYMILFVMAFLMGIQLIWRRKIPNVMNQRLIGVYILIGTILILSHQSLFRLMTNGDIRPSIIRFTWELFWLDVKGPVHDLGGGFVGALLYTISTYLFADLGTKWIAIALFIVGAVIITGKTLQGTVGKFFMHLWSYVYNQWIEFKNDVTVFLNRKPQNRNRRVRIIQPSQSPEQTIETDGEDHVPPIISGFSNPLDSDVEEAEQQISITFVEEENTSYELPPYELLHIPKIVDQSKEREHIYDNARKLEKTFQSFGVKAKITQVHLGPAVTKYEVYPDVGVKVSKIVSLSDDLALALATKSIRIEAPIPGKSAVGIEVPNEKIAIVSLREVLQDKVRPESKLLVALGRDISGQAVVAELNKMPHLLIAGATGSGKSVCVNGIITSLLMRTKPHEVKMMMIDPKMVELNIYNGIPHLLAPVVTDPKKASQALKKVVSEMERRYELFASSGTRNIEGYNDQIRRHNEKEENKQFTLPYIVVIIDELADLMLVASNDVEDAIMRLAQMARAAGIHLIIATQRPSVDVITGVIKANIPSRIAFSVSSQIDSRTILDMGGAEKLLGRGDMLFLPIGESKPIRVQGSFLSDDEVESVVSFVIKQQKAQYNEEMIPTDVQQTSKSEDELYNEAVQLVITMQSASVSLLQRRFRIGYNRAARLIDAMEEHGIVGGHEGSKPRTVLLSNYNEKTS